MAVSACASKCTFFLSFFSAFLASLSSFLSAFLASFLASFLAYFSSAEISGFSFFSALASVTTAATGSLTASYWITLGLYCFLVSLTSSTGEALEEEVTGSSASDFLFSIFSARLAAFLSFLCSSFLAFLAAFKVSFYSSVNLPSTSASALTSLST